MKYTAALLTAMMAAGAVAAPNTAARRARAEKRAAGVATTKKTVPPKYAGINETTNADESYNWAGAVIVSSDITEVTGTFTVPIPTGSGSGSAWVGIDGDTCQTAIIQTGVDWTISGGKISYDAWYEWYPDYAYDFSDFTVSAGDEIKATVVATSKTAGTATLENVSTGASTSYTWDGDVEGDLCLENAEWIVEDFTEGDSLVAFADFGTVTFTDASYIADGTTEGVTGGTAIDLISETNNAILAECSVASSSSVTCTYV